MSSGKPQNELRAPEQDPELLEELFLAGSDLDQPERDRFLDERCAGKLELRSTLDRLLEVSDETGSASLWEQSALQLEARQLAQDQGLSFTRLGPYKILSRIGAGGMGAVYLAERDDEGFQKQVAIKFVPRPFLNEDALRRFRQERQIQARLEHPNIARILDAGQTPDGLPYLVMEFVDGVPIDQYAVQHGLTVERKLELCRAVCDAVSYAHSNLIVHRDLKPGNILVTPDGVPKLLDFGIAKLLNDSGVDATSSTRVMAASYASPEQIAGRPITTASDVYSLGVVLRTLLSNPVGPLPADLDNILGKAMREEPERRYASVADFSEDLTRYLGGYPVKARPDTFGYRTRKFLKRRRLEVAIALTAVIGLAVAAALTLAQYRESSRRFEDTRNLVNSFLFEVNDAIADVPGTTSARHLLAQRAQQYLDILARDRSSDPAVQRDLALAYRKLGDVLGRPYYPNLGDTAGALANYRKAAELLERLSARGYQDPGLMTELGLLYGRQGKVSSREGKAEETLRLSQKGVDLLERSLARNSSSRDLRLELANAYANVAWAWLGIGGDKHSPEPAQRMRESLAKALTIALPAIAQSPGDDQFHFVAARCYQGLALAEATVGLYGDDPGVWRRQLAFDLKAHEQILAVYRINPSKYRRVMGSSWDELDRAYLQAGDASNALKAGKESLVYFEEIASSDPGNKESRRDLARAHEAIGADLDALHRDREAAAERQRALEFLEGIIDRDPNSFQDLLYDAQLRHVIADRALRAGDRATARAHCQRSLDLLANRNEIGATIEAALDYALLGDASASQAEAASAFGKALALWERLRDSGQLPPKYAGKPAQLNETLAHMRIAR